MRQCHTAKRRSYVRFCAATAAALSTIVLSGRAKAQTLIFDDITGFQSGATGASATYAGGSGTSFVGGYFTLPTGTTSITGFDLAPINGTTSPITYLQLNVYVWGAINTTTAITAATPAFSDELAQYTAYYTFGTALPSGGHYTIFETGDPGMTPGLTLGTPLNVTGLKAIGLSYNFQTSTTGATGSYNSATGLTSIISYGVQPTTALSGTFYPYFFLNQGGETNGNFNEGPYIFTGTSDDELAARIFGTVASNTSSSTINWNNAFSGDWNTASNWMPNTVPTITNIAAFNLSSGGYTVSASQNQSAAAVYVQFDNVTIDLNQASSSLTIAGPLTVGVPQTSGQSIVGVLYLTHSFSSSSPGNVSAASVVVGGNGGTGMLTIGSGSTSNALTLSVGNSSSGLVSVSTGSSLIMTAGAKLIAPNSNLTLSIAGATGAWTGLVDIGPGQLDLASPTSLATVSDQVKQGFNGGTWQGSGGITSSMAAASSAHLTAVGVISNNNGGSALYGNGTKLGTFNGQNPGLNDVLVKYTYYGDANLDGKVDGSDYSLIDSSYLAEATETVPFSFGISGWFNGDFNYDGVVDGSDYTLMDNAFNQQGASGVSPDAILGGGSGGANAFVTGSPTEYQIATSSTPVGLAGSGSASPTASIAGSPVPEPASLAFTGFCAMGLLGRRSRRLA